MTVDQVMKYCIFEFIRGSQAYGTNVEDSDTDYGGVTLTPSLDILYGFNKFTSMEGGFGFQDNGKKLDKVIYNFPTAINLMVDNNPNMMDYLFCSDRVILKTSPEWNRVRDNRDLFISSKCKYTYQGYAVAQIHRLKTHHDWAMRGDIKAPNRTDYNLPEVSIFPETQLESIARLSSDYIAGENVEAFKSELTYLICTDGANIFRKYMQDPDVSVYALEDFKREQQSFVGMLSSISGKFLKDEYIGMAAAELQYLSAVKEYKSYCEWKSKRNPDRLKLELKCGYDSKHGMHAYRLASMCVEILSGKGVIVDRTGIDREYLLDIRNGNVSYDALMDGINALSKESDKLYLTTTIPKYPQLDKINTIKMEIMNAHAEELIKHANSNR